MRTARFWWIAAGIFLRPVRLVRGAGAPDEISDRDRLQRRRRPPGRWAREPGRHSWPDRARPCVRPYRARMGVDGRQPGLRALLPGPAWAPPRPTPTLLYLMVVAQGMLGYGLTSVHRRRSRPRSSRAALRDDLRHADAGRYRGRGRRAVGDRRAARRHRAAMPWPSGSLLGAARCRRGRSGSQRRARCGPSPAASARDAAHAEPFSGVVREVSQGRGDADLQCITQALRPDHYRDSTPHSGHGFPLGAGVGWWSRTAPWRAGSGCGSDSQMEGS